MSNTTGLVGVRLPAAINGSSKKARTSYGEENDDEKRCEGCGLSGAVSGVHFALPPRGL